ncbi:MAG TPA: ABC transporter permease [Bryobacteraceae bacterium]|jgi:predicted permease
MNDLRYATRQFRRSPGFFAAACLLIALGVAANTQIFTFVNTLLLRPLPVSDPQSLIQLFLIRPRLPLYPYFDYPFLKLLASKSTTLTETAGHIEWILPLERPGGSAERAHPYCVTANFFTDLGVRPLLGRLLQAGDDHAAVLSYAYWSSAFGRDPRVIGQTIRIKGHAFRIAGVAPEGFSGTIIDSSPDVWVPFQNSTDFSGMTNPSLDNFAIEITARLRRGVTPAQAEQETAALWIRYQEEAFAADPKNHDLPGNRHLELHSLTYGLSPLRDQSRSALLLMLAGAGLLLLMVCANVSGLLLARAAARDKETAVRLAVGASRGRIARQRLIETLLLAAVGGAAGIGAAYASIPFVIRLLPPARGIGNDPAELRTLTIDFRPDFRVLVFSIGICALVAILSALVPAWRTSRYDLSTALKSSMSDPRHARFQAWLCALQVALCTVLLSGAGLMARTLENLRNLKTGFDPSHVSIFSMDPHSRGYDGQQAWLFERRLLDAVRALPGVDAAAISNRALMRGIGLVSWIVFPGQHGDGLPNTSAMSVSPDYFRVMGMHLIAGRQLKEGDLEEDGKTSRVVVNEAFVRKFFPAQDDPLGKQFSMGKEYAKPGYEIVGVVNDTNYRSLREVPPPVMYSYGLGPKKYPDTFVLHVRSRGNPREMIQRVQALVKSSDPQMPVYEVAALTDDIDRSLWQERLLVALASGFGAFAIALAAIGLYGILAHFVAGRRREIGLRIALGAEPGRVVWLVVQRIVPAVAGGIISGAAFSWISGRWLTSLLYRVQPFDLTSMIATLALLLAAGIAAAAIPVIRVIRLDPASTLRQE